MPRFTPAASATSRTESPAQPRCGSSARPAASSARSRLREGRGMQKLYDCLIMASSYAAASPRPRPHSMSSAAASPDDDALFRMARQEIALGRFEAALGRLRSLRARLAAPNASVETELGMLYQRRGRQPEALPAPEAS